VVAPSAKGRADSDAGAPADRAAAPVGTEPDAAGTETAEPPSARARRWPRRLRRVLFWAFTALLALAVVAGIAGVWAVRRSFPQYGGALRLAGLTAPVTVYRDAHAIPQIYAQNLPDLMRAQGYIHAQERFWEMDFRRHVTAGRLSELFGGSQLDTDKYLRTLGWRRVAEAEWNILSAEVKALLTEYAEGVNAWLAANAPGGRPGTKVSLEYGVLALQNGDYRIESWHPVDSLAWLKAMAWDLRGNMVEEMERAALLGDGFTREQIEQLFPPYPYDRNRPIVDGGGVRDGAFAAQPVAAATPARAAGVSAATPAAAAPLFAALAERTAKLPRLLGRSGPGIGSNSWVLSGARTTTGRPILANDPHLSPMMPSIWFQVGLHCACGFNAAGFSFSGVPGIVIGHNDRVAWGFTNLGPDVTDLYLERITGDEYEVDGQRRPLEKREETIRVAGGKPVTITVRTTRHGPLLSDVSEDLRDIGGGHGVALRWTALDAGRTAEALFGLNTARDWTQFRAAAALFEVPSQNIVYADVDGNIGYQSPGRIPVRGKGDGKWPAPGWDPGYDWTGMVPFAELPTLYNPAQGYVVTANQAVTGPGYPRFLTDDWSYGYRSQRLNELIGGGGKLSIEDVQRIQMDSRNGLAPALVPALLAAPVSERAARARELLRDWDYQQPADGRRGSPQARSSAAAAYFNAVWRQVLLRTFDELPEDFRPGGEDRWFEVVRALLATPSSPWWDDRSTPSTEDATAILVAAQREADEELRDRLGADPQNWRWGKLHTLAVRNQTFGESGIAPIEWLFNHPAAGVSGGSSIVNATGWYVPDGYEVDWVPSMRMVVDLSDLDGSRWINLTGASGHAFSDHYSDQFELWRTGRTVPMRWTEDAIQREARNTLILRP
jgi:penicillin G amidase